jgi:glycosyltransferase involved in cell wall biosynthesis
MNIRMKYRSAIFTNIAPLYSRSLWYKLSSSENIDYSFYSSGKGFSGIKTIDINESKTINQKGLLNWFFLKNFFIGRILVYQSGIISKCLKTDFDAYILSGEMYSISSWIAAIICKIRRKPLLFWGHGLYGDERNIKKIVRNLYYKIADYHLVYGKRSREFMIDSGLNPDKIFTVYNSLDYDAHCKIYEERNLNELLKIKSTLFPENETLPVVLFIGRLTEEKKISYLIEAISLCNNKGNRYNCLIVGGGEKSEDLQKLAVSLGIKDLICFYGPSYDENINSRLIMLSECCVSPGNIGLTAIHSLSLGTPVITHGNFFNQGPEVESVIQDRTGLFFEENNVVNLSEVIDYIIANKKKSSMETFCIEQVKKYWNPINQARIFDEALLDLIKNRKN